MKKNILIGFMVVLAPLVTFADTKLSSTTTIKKMYTYKSGVVLELSNPMATNSGCTYAKSGRYVALRYTSKELYSAFLSAYVAKKPVKIGTKGCDDIWSAEGTMNKVYKLVLQ